MGVYTYMAEGVDKVVPLGQSLTSFKALTSRQKDKAEVPTAKKP